ncbi:MAG TPA: hypothetical protein VGB30_10830 [bacterium]|jgi:hypothetical protein
MQKSTGINDISNKASYWILAGILVLNFACLYPAVGLYFNGDDFVNIRAPELNSISGLPPVLSYAVSKGTRFLHLGIYFSAGNALFGRNSSLWHLSSVIMFAISVICLHWMLCAMTKNRLASVIGAGLFALSGTMFYAQVWITGVVESMAGIFVFSSTAAHVLSLKIDASQKKWILISSVLIAFAFLTKETTLLIIPVWIFLDILLLRKISIAAAIGIFLAIGIAFFGWPRIYETTTVEGYAFSTKIVAIILNLAWYSIDYFFSTGLSAFMLQKASSFESASDFIPFLKNHPVLVIPYIMALLAFISLMAYSIPRGYMVRPDGKKEAGWAGWAFFLILLAPAILIPSHHYPYYLLVPSGFLAVTLSTAIASNFKKSKLPTGVIAMLIVYALWFPVNSYLAFKYSPLTTNTRLVESMIAAVEEYYPDHPAGLKVIYDHVPHSLGRASEFGKAIELYYGDVNAQTFPDFHARLDQQGDRVYDFSKERIVLRLVNGEWIDVTGEFNQRFNLN